MRFERKREERHSIAKQKNQNSSGKLVRCIVFVTSKHVFVFVFYSNVSGRQVQMRLIPCTEHSLYPVEMLSFHANTQQLDIISFLLLIFNFRGFR